MSIILKGNNINYNNNGIGPSEVTNIKASQNASSIILSWANPSNVIINGSTLSTFSYVTIIRNEERYPMSIKDGKMVYSGNGTTCADSDVVKNKKYYYRFFVYDTNKLYNDNISMICESTFYGVDPILKNNSWEQVTNAIDSGSIPSTWNIGDEIDLTLSGEFNETVTLQIWDFNHFDKSDGSGKASICFGMKNLMKDKQYMYQNFSSNGNGWDTMQLRTEIMDKILSSFPANLQSYIKEVYTYSNLGQHADEDSRGRLSKDKLFIPGSVEVGITDQANTEKGQEQFLIFTDNNSRIKKMNNGSGSAESWWTRSAESGSSNSFVYIYTNGKSSFSYHGGVQPSYSLGICFCFNI